MDPKQSLWKRTDRWLWMNNLLFQYLPLRKWVQNLIFFSFLFNVRHPIIASSVMGNVLLWCILWASGKICWQVRCLPTPLLPLALQPYYLPSSVTAFSKFMITRAPDECSRATDVLKGVFFVIFGVQALWVSPHIVWWTDCSHQMSQWRCECYFPRGDIFNMFFFFKGAGLFTNELHVKQFSHLGLLRWFPKAASHPHPAASLNTICVWMLNRWKHTEPNVSIYMV